MTSNIPIQQFAVINGKTVLFYTKLKTKSLLVLSILNFFCWSVSSSLQVFTIAMSHGVPIYKQSGSLMSVWNNTEDAAACGIWCAVFYMITAFLGYSASYAPTKQLLVSTLVFSVLSILSSLVADAVASLAQAYNCISSISDSIVSTNSVDQICYNWKSIERALMTVSFFAAIINLVVLVLVSMAIQAGTQSMSINRHELTQSRQDHLNDDTTSILIQNPTPLMRFPFQITYKPQPQQQLSQVGLPDEDI